VPDIPPGASDLIVLAFLVAYLINSWVSHRKMNIVKNEVKNTHKTNLRDDLDELKAGQREMHQLLVEVDSRTVRIGAEVRVNREAQDADRKVMYGAIARAERLVAKNHPKDAL
jgi:hypothetical protein